MANSTQLWYGNPTGFGIEKIYDEPYLITFENKKGDYASVMIDYRKVVEYHGEGAWNHARKYAEEKLFERERAEQEGWVY